MKSKKADNAFVYENLLEEAAEQLKALGHPLRLRILDFLRENGESSVGEIVRRTKAPQATVSLHLGRMRRCGIVISRREAREVYYWIATEIAQVVADALHRKHDRALGLDPLS
ncbi:MAG TPA: winged helix-turn-helix transcriptional regulator [Candidatus Spyradosoma merdigallinarum]|uniref:Winged helix-turn-helix transcriptional regulator n=1 Tax=Candidatus Spyradosoma merdigallinarum TaxID=2840950 RepID=A0A9D1NJ85_9BACT|nr:winged helix-turn-helix transcriptional regulator [Candidatus Spyradosoma merdigallinarum]